MALKFVKSNFNDRIRFKPTAYGLYIMERDYLELRERIGGKGAPFNAHLDEEGYRTMQVHSFIHQFGDFMGLTMKSAVEMEFYIQTPETDNIVTPTGSRWICVDRDKVSHGVMCTVIDGSFDDGTLVHVEYDPEPWLTLTKAMMKRERFLKEFVRVNDK